MRATPSVTDPLPAQLAERFLGLRAALDAAIPAKQLDRVTRGKAGNNERMAFASTSAGRPSGLAGEPVVAIETSTSVSATGLGKQFARGVEFSVR